MGTGRRILHLTSSMGLGGAEKQILDLCRALDDRGYDVSILSLTEVGRLGRRARAEGIAVDALGLEPRLSHVPGVVRIYRHLSRTNPDVLHSHMYHSNVISRLLSPFLRETSHVCTVHNTYETSGGKLPDRTVRERTYRLTDRLCETTTFVSRASRERYRRIGAVSEDGSRVVHNGIDPEEFAFDEQARARVREDAGVDDEFVWLAVGSFTRQKDYATLLQAFARLNGDVKLWIIGHGRREPEVVEQLRTLDLRDRTTMLGVVEHVAPYLAAADGFVTSSLWEGLSIALLEAMACERPVVATDSGSPSEILTDGENGFLVPTSDPGALARAMASVQELSDAERRQLGRNALDTIEARFGIDAIAEEWIRLYEAVAPS